jgi:predicted dithiol-disulfide oxidoreductase (DUF899 family)
MAMNKIVSGEEWLEAPKALLRKEKEFTSLRDKLSEQRRDLPWVSVNTEDFPRFWVRRDDEYAKKFCS